MGAQAPGRRRGPDAGQRYAVALEWTALHPSATADAILELDTATDWDSFRAAAADFAVPAQNLVYADTEGHIGYQAPGPDPDPQVRQRRPAAGRRAGGRRTTGAATYVPFDGLPSCSTPTRASSSPPTRR